MTADNEHPKATKMLAELGVLADQIETGRQAGIRRREVWLKLRRLDAEMDRSKYARITYGRIADASGLKSPASIIRDVGTEAKEPA